MLHSNQKAQMESNPQDRGGKVLGYARSAGALFFMWAFTVNAFAALISVDLQSSFGSEGRNFTGVETEAASFNSSFGNANVWNHFGIRGLQVPTPSLANLVDSTGINTGATFAITTGSVSAFGFFGRGGTDDLLSDFFLWNGRDNPGTVNWAISGLTPNTEYSLFVYGSKANQIRYFDMLIDTDGDNTLADETAKPVGSAANNQTVALNAYFASVVSDNAGKIVGRGTARGNIQANWGGFQLAQVLPIPEPASLALLGLGLVGLGFTRYRRRA